MQSSSTEWRSSLADLNFEDGCEVLSDVHGMENFARSMQLDVIGVLTQRDDSLSLPDALCLKLGLTRQEAKTRVRVASALLNLPCLSEAFRTGVVDWNRLVLVTQLAETTEDDELWAATANDHLLNQLKVMLARKKAGDVSAAQKAHAERDVKFRHNDNKQESIITIRQPIDVGIAMEKATQERADSYGIDEATGEYKTPQHARADAFCDIFFGESAPRAEMLVDVEPAALNGDGKADLEGHAINVQTLRRLACDASVRLSYIDGGGLPLALGRKARLFPPWLQRQIHHRDRGCRFPGCGSTLWLHYHHMFEWDEDEGPTDYENAVALCGTHHRALHEGGWKIRGNANEELAFISPSGKALTGRAPVIEKKTAGALQLTAFAVVDRVTQERQALEVQRHVEKIECEQRLQQRREEAERRNEEARRLEREALARSAHEYTGWGDPAA